MRVRPERRGRDAQQPLLDHHDLSRFCCGQDSLDDWLRRFARPSEGKSARTFVVCDADRVVGYHCLANGSVSREELPKTLRFSMPDPVPVMIIGRLAVDRDHAGRGIGRGLIKDVLRRVAHVAQTSGFRAVLVHAIDEAAVGFYLRYGFRAFPAGSRTMFLSSGTLRAAVTAG